MSNGLAREPYSLALDHAVEAERLYEAIGFHEENPGRTPMQEAKYRTAQIRFPREVALAGMWAAVELARYADRS